MFATADQILGRKPTVTDVSCPELGEGVVVRVKRPDAAAYIAIVQQIKADSAHAYAYWIAATAMSEDGKPLFTFEQATQLAEVDYSLVERLTTAAMGGASGEAQAGGSTR